MNRKTQGGIWFWFATLLCLGGASSTWAASRFDNVKVQAVQVKNNVYLVTGSGGNIGVLVGPDGTLMIDDQFEPLAPKIESAIAKVRNGITPKIKYVVNTHYHGDHTGGNSYFSKSASILAHENVRSRLLAKSKLGLPVITYQEGVKLHLNGETIHVRHLSSGHTDGDSVVLFEQHDVWHLGDLLFESRFPYIDTDGGGSVKGYIANLTTLINQIGKDAVVIPGHGKLTDVNGIRQSRDMIVETWSEIKKMKQQGLLLPEIIRIGLNEKWNSWSWSFINEERWIKTLYHAVE